MESGAQLSHRFTEVILNGRWIANTNFKDQLSTLDWTLAVTGIHSLNTIELLTRHIHYYIAGVIKVFEGGPLDIKDKHSFAFTPVQSQKEWDDVKLRLWADAEKFASLVEQMPEEKLSSVFVDEKYGTYRRNIEAMIEHCYYHLGQIVLLKKIVLNKS
ncbi:MAG: DUF1572 domain-containing protein [Agriterribacter sp.]